MQCRAWQKDWGNRLVLILALWVLLGIAWDSLGWSGPVASFVVGVLFRTPLMGAAVLLSWRVTRREGLTNRQRRPWQIMAAAYASYFLGCLFWVYYQVQGNAPLTALASMGMMAFYPLMFWGLLRYPTTRDITGTGRQLLLIDVAITVIAGWGVMGFALAEGLVRLAQSDLLRAALSLSYPIGDMALFFGATLAWLRGRRTWGDPLMLIVGGSFLMVVADLAWKYLELVGKYQPGAWADQLYLPAMFLLALSANRAHATFGQPAASAHRSDLDPPQSLVPYLGVILGGIWPTALAFSSQGHGSWLRTALVLMADLLMTGLMVMRFMVISATNRGLLSESLARRKEAWFRSLVQHSFDVITIVNTDGLITYLSPSVEQIFGVAASQVMGSALTTWVHEEDRSALAALLADLAGRPTGAHAVTEGRARHGDGTWLYVEATVTNLIADPEIGGLVLNLRDVTERRQLEDQLRQRAYHDDLTGLANRALFVQRGERLAMNCSPNAPVTVLVLDLDNFKTVNDSLGHTQGDYLLREVAARLAGAVRSGDTVARFGGDEFAVLLGNARPEAAQQVAERILAAFGAPFSLSGGEIFVQPSIGLATVESTPVSLDDLVRNADIAMYAAKRNGKAQWVLFDPAMQERVRRRLEMENDLRRALERKEFFLEFQPVFDLTSGYVKAVEALIRWEHPVLGRTPPGEFIPLAEDTGLIVPIGRWVLEEACRQALTWSLPSGTAPRVSVNLAARQFRDPRLVSVIHSVLAETGLDPHRLQLEVTETDLITDLEASRQVLLELRGRGMTVALDDFGMGYASLSYLKRLPVDVIKLDRSFVAGIGRNSTDTAIIEAVLTLARACRAFVTAEGVETEDQVAVLRAMGCHRAQGYYLARPMPADKIRGFLAEYKKA